MRKLNALVGLMGSPSTVPKVALSGHIGTLSSGRHICIIPSLDDPPAFGQRSLDLAEVRHRRIAAMARSTLASEVCQFKTLTRIARRSRQLVPIK